MEAAAPEPNQPILSNSPLPESHPHPKNHLSKIIIAGVIFLLLCSALVFGYTLTQQTETKIVPPTEPSPTAVVDETSNWKTYSHKLISFKYPPNWIPQDNPEYPGGNNISFFLEDSVPDHTYGDHSGNEVFTFTIGKNALSLDEAKNKYYPDSIYTQIDGKNALKTSFGLYVVKINDQQELALVTGKSAQNITDQILSTFRFLGGEDSTENSLNMEQVFASYTMPLNEPALNICYGGATVNGEITKECLYFYKDGKILWKHAHVDDTIIKQKEITDNMSEASEKVKGYYNELIGGRFNTWLEGPGGVPISGGFGESITVHSKDQNSSLSSQTAATTFRWGMDYSEEGKRLKEIFSDLKQYKPVE